MTNNFFLILIVFVFASACSEENQIKDEVSKIQVDLVVERFDKVYQKATADDLPNLKEAYPFLFSKQVPDSIWVSRLQDTLQKQLLHEVSQKFNGLKRVSFDLKRLFQHLKYYDKTFSVPRVITLTNDVDYRNKVIVTDSLVLVALDNFLGEDHEFYQNIPRYLAKTMTQNQVVQQIADRYAKKYVYQSQRKSFLDEMIYHGKCLYFKDAVLPFTTQEERIGYSKAQLQWAQANESPIWSYFVEKELLFSSHTKLINRFISEAPFSKFYLELDSESPGKLGQYIGWQIVKAYADVSGGSPMSVISKSPQEIFKIAKFKPKK